MWEKEQEAAKTGEHSRRMNRSSILRHSVDME
jgi:hypothetical protein